MPLPLQYSLRSVWVRRSATLATVGGIALVVFVLASSQMLAAGLRRTLGSAGSDDRAIVLQNSAYAEPNSQLQQAVLGMVAAAPGVRPNSAGAPLVTGESVVQAMLPSAQDPERVVSVLVRGVSGNVLELRPYVRVVQGRAPQPGTYEAMVGVRLAGRYRGLERGGSLELESGRKIDVVGVFEAHDTAYESEVWADLDAVRTSLSWQGYVSSATVQLASASAFDGFADEVKTRTNSDAVAERESAYYERISRGLSRLISGLGALIALIFSFGAMLGAAITMYSSVEQRTKEIGVFRALGFERNHVLGALLFESGALSLAGAVVGAALAASTSFFELATMNGVTGAQISIRFQPTLEITVASIVAGTLVGLMGGFFPALRAARVDPIEAIKS